jgi:site-specific recombinase XerD
VRVGNWLTAEEGKKLLGAETAYTLRSRRNRALLSLLIGCGLRRSEATTLRLEDLQLTYASSSRSGSLGVEKSFDLYKRTQS